MLSMQACFGLGWLHCLLYSFLLLQPIIKVCKQQVRSELVLCVIYLEVQGKIVRSEKEVANVAKRILFMLL